MIDGQDDLPCDVAAIIVIVPFGRCNPETCEDDLARRAPARAEPQRIEPLGGSALAERLTVARRQAHGRRACLPIERDHVERQLCNAARGGAGEIKIAEAVAPNAIRRA